MKPAYLLLGASVAALAVSIILTAAHMGTSPDPAPRLLRGRRGMPQPVVRQAKEVTAHKRPNRTSLRAEQSANLQLLPQFPAPSGLPPDAARRDAVKEAMQHAWKAYEQYAFGADSLKPLSKQSGGSFLGEMGVTLIDSLDTLWLMGLRAEFHRAAEWVRDKLHFGKQENINVFETTIRIVGGLLSAHTLSGEDLFARRARQLADEMAFAFDTPTGIPYSTVGLSSKRRYNPQWAHGSTSVSEVATVQLEHQYLTEITGQPSYAATVDRVMHHLHGLKVKDGLFGMFIDPVSGKITDETITFGARADSLYEYLLKQWLRKPVPSNRFLLDMYVEAIAGAEKRLLQRSTPSGMTYVAERAAGGQLVHKMDHLVCFLPGTLALGAVEMEDKTVAQRHLQLAHELAYTCYQMYKQQRTGLAPELVEFRAGQDMTNRVGTTYSLLRPEAVEAFFYLYRATGRNIYRQWGWDVFQSMNKYARTDGGFASVEDVTASSPRLRDSMESFFLAETLKYLYLLFASDDVLPLHRYVFNTEAHPLPIVSARPSL